MAENFTRAFGRYLKTLRERRSLSLDDVASLSQNSPEPINKGYLSRCENGHQKLAFPKVVPLSRIYQVEADVLVERIELDMEVDRVGGPDTEGMTFDQLTSAGRSALNKGYHLITYGFLRDAVVRAGTDPVSGSFKNLDEQVSIAHMSCATAAKTLGRYRYALHEYLFLETSGYFGPKHRPIILGRVASTLRLVGELERAQRYADASLREAHTSGETEYLGFLYSARGIIAHDISGPKEASRYHEKAFSAHKAVGRSVECTRSLLNLAQCHFDLKRYRAARRALDAAARISEEEKLPRCRALSLILLGEIEERENRPLRAGRHWKEAVTIAKQLNDRQLRFKAEFGLFRRALQDGDAAVARAIERRLTKLSAWIPTNTDELQAFQRLTSERF